MKNLFLVILLIQSVFLCTAEASQLTKVVRLDAKDLVQIYFTFDTIPTFKATSINRRIDLIFADSTLSSSATFFPPDQDIVKILPRPGKSELIISVFFRYPPQKFKLTKNPDGKIVFETRFSNEYTKTYQNLAKRLKGISEIDQVSVDFSNPSIRTPYKKDWMSFFTSYESPVSINVAVKFTAPPFPIIRFLPPGLESNLKLLFPDVFELAEKGAWGQISDKILEKLQQTQEVEAKKMLALTLGETLLHQGNFEGAYKQLYLLKEKYPEELIGTYAKFLLIHLRAKFQDPHIAEYELQTLDSTLGHDSPLSPYLYIGRIEAALVSAKFTEMNTLLNDDDIALPDDLQEIRQIRQADYWFATKKPVKAFAAYQLLADSILLRSQPYSLNGNCSSSYQQKKFKEAAICYDELGAEVTDKTLLGLIAYRKNMAKLKFQDGASLINDFAQIENAYPGSEAGFRAAIKKNDLLYRQNRSYAKQALEKYGEIADNALDRPVREEAFFKQALIHSQLGEKARSIELLQQFLREFHIGDVRISAQALLIDILPDEIKRLVEKKEYVKALVLAKQNKELFQNNWINSKFLSDIAEAYHHVGLFDEAQKLYLYLIEIMPVDQRERFYLPMIQSTFDQGNYGLVEDYSSQYFFNYPKGKNINEILALRLNALMADERLSEAIKLLPSPLPDNKELYEIASSLYYRSDDYKNCLSVLKKLAVLQSPLPPKEQFMLAECLYQTSTFAEAESIFRTITEENPFYEQALFRLASLERKKGNEQMALSLFKKIVEIGKSSLWEKFAERELQFAKEAARH